MSSKAKMVQEVKKDIRSLLISAQRGLTSTMLLDDYQQFIGYPLPYRKLGYNAPIDFIRDISDVVQITWEGSMMVLRAVVNEDTQRVASLVARQKENRPRRMYERRTQTRPKPPLPAPTVPAVLRTQVKQLLMAYPSGIQSSSFNTAFGRRFGTHINYTKLGYKSMGELLRALRDVIVIRPQAGNTFRIYSRDGPGTGATNTVSHTNYTKEPYQAESYLKEKIPSLTKLQDEQVKPASSPQQTQPAPKPDPVACGAIDPQLKEEIREVLAERPNGMWAKRLPFEYKRKLGKDLNMLQHGFYSVIEMLSAMADVAVIKRPNPQGDWWLHEQKAYNKREEEKASGPTIAPASLEMQIVQVLLRHPEGIKSKQFPDIFKTLTGQTLPVEERGYKSTETLLLNMPDYVRMVYKGAGTVMLYAREDAMQKLQVTQQLAAKQEQPKSRVKRDDHEGIPIDAVGSGVFYPQLPFPEPTMEEPLYIEVYICNVVDPGNFHVQFRGQQTADALEQLMDRLEKVYCSEESKSYKMRPDLIAIGQACVAIFPEDENWHRALITAIPSLDFVTVSYVDYGTIASVPKSALRMLKAEFLHLPIQAVNARLANIQPNSPDNKWTSAARDRLLNLTRDKPLVALVTDIQDRVLSLCPCDTTTEQDIHINDTLVSEGYAVLCPDSLGLGAEVPNAEITLGETSQSVNQESDAPPLTNQESGGVPGGVAQLQDLQDVVMPGMIGSIYPSLFPTFPELSNGLLYSDEQSSHLDMSCLTDRREAAGEDQPLPGQDNTRQPSEEDDEFMQQVCKELDMEEQETEPPKPRQIRQVQLTEEHLVSIIKYQDKPYVMSGEISAFFWDSDLLRSMLRQKKLVMPKEVVSSEICPELFEELQRLEVRGIYDGDSLRTHVTVYELQCIPEILSAFEHPSQELADRIQEELQNFDPEHPYWKGIDLPEEDSLEEDEEDDDESDEFEFTLDQLRLTLQTLQIRRQRILHEMVNSPEACSVDELKGVEQQMTDVRNRIKRKEEEEAEDELVSSFRPLGFQASPLDEVVQRCVDQQHQSQTRGGGDTDTGGHTDTDRPAEQVVEKSGQDEGEDKSGVHRSSLKEVATSKKKELAPKEQGEVPQACDVQTSERKTVSVTKAAVEVGEARPPQIPVHQSVQAPSKNAVSHPVVAPVKPQQGPTGRVGGVTTVRPRPAVPAHQPVPNMAPYMQAPGERLPGMYQQPVQYTVTATAQYYQQYTPQQYSPQYNPQQHNPQQHNPQQYNPQMYNPQQHNPQQYNPQQHNPQPYNPQQLNPQQYLPQQHNPQQYNPQQYNPQQQHSQQYNPQQYTPYPSSFINQNEVPISQGYFTPGMQVQPYHGMMFNSGGGMYGVGGQIPLGQGRGHTMPNNSNR